MKKTLFFSIGVISLSLMMLMSVFVGCTGEGDDTTEADTSADDTTAETVTDLAVFEAGADKSDYVIIRPEKNERDTDAALDLRKTLQDTYSVSFDLKDDWYKSEEDIPEYEILVGAVNRPEVKDAVDAISALKSQEEAFTVRTVGKKLIIVANSSSMYEAAFNYIMENYIKEGAFIVPENLIYMSDITIIQPSQYITAEGELNVKMSELFTVSSVKDASGNNCRIVQGGCTDGTYYYNCMNNGADTGAVTAIVKTEIATGNVVGVYEGYLLDHSNDMAYNTKTDEIVVIHNAPNRLLVTVIDAKTMEVKFTKKCKLELYAIAYDEQEDCYWVGIAHGYNYAKLDTNFNQIGKTFKGYNNGFTKQGMDVDDKYVYFVLYKTNCIAVYDKAGNYIRQIDIPVTAGEPENICHIGSTFYIGYNNPSWTGGIIYATEIKPAE